MSKENENLKEQVTYLKEDLQDQKENLRVQNNQSRARLARNSGLGILALAGGLIGGILIGRGCDSGDNAGAEKAPISKPVNSPTETLEERVDNRVNTVLAGQAKLGTPLATATIGSERYTVTVTRVADTATPTPIESTATATATAKKAEATAVPTAPKVEATAVPAAPTVEAPQATKVAGGETTVIESFVIQGAQDRVDAKNVDTAKGVFKNTIGLGSEMILADPGVLKVGWDFPQDQFKAAGENIYHYDSGNQSILHTPESFVNVPEGAFAMFNGNAMIIEVSGNGSARFHLEIPGPVNNHNIVIIRGLYRDGNSPEDRNRIAKITGYTPGAVLYDMYPKGGFVSQGHVEQIAKNALTNSPNCGAEACRTVTLYLVDENTSAYSVLKTSGQGWTSVTSNWK